ncbi:peptidoglycan DD-metalloendopeptidase family protein [Thermus thermamylovorans]|uniref:M23 family peptidase n=1 Tax=Thermus thermamylovorans TaxID=2509362 RepID=A0A4Q9B7S6_9DEIN|nr:peptidoglycan DD-metalloendopeptidase family protein [Thermus thermamylovorans]TBH21203.1 M23 family peptidase [Thermus thermamylovorans]
MGWKPGHYLLLALLLYALAVSLGFSVRGRQLAELRQEAVLLRKRAGEVPEGYRLPLPGACLPRRPENLPNAPRAYRQGVSAGFVFRDGDACVPVVRGMGVVAAASGVVVKVDWDHREPTREGWEALLEAVREGASPEQMDVLRGLEVWLRHPDGRTTVYAHLQAPYPGLAVGARVHRGDPIGYLGSTGLLGGGPRLLLEVWEGEPDRSPFLFQGLPPEELLRQASAFFALD